MRLYVVRHAKAEKAAPGEPDAPRTLNAKGRRQAHDLGVRLAALAEPPALVVTSPLVRARQTAEAIAQACEIELRVDERLAPGASAADVLALVSGERGPVVTVGHQPDCSEIAAELTGRDPGFPTAGMLEIELEA
jgi:phosphohistidine phosphatase